MENIGGVNSVSVHVNQCSFLETLTGEKHTVVGLWCFMKTVPASPFLECVQLLN